MQSVLKPLSRFAKTRRGGHLFTTVKLIPLSSKLCTMKVKACEQVRESIYTVTDDDDVTSRTVNLLVATGAPHSACANVLSKHFVKVKEMSGLYQIITLSIWYSFI